MASPTSRRSSRSARRTRSRPSSSRSRSRGSSAPRRKRRWWFRPRAQQGVPEVLRALVKVIDGERAASGEPAAGRSLASVIAKRLPLVRHGFGHKPKHAPCPARHQRSTDFRRIVVKVGSSLLVDCRGRPRQRDWLASLADDIAELHRDKRDILVVSSGAIALGRAVLKLPRGPLKLEDSQAAAAVGQIALARTWAEALGRHGISAGQILRHARRHRGAAPLSQRALHHRQAARMAQRAGDQRERHRRHQRDPLWRQRPARGARRHHGERRPAGAALRCRRALRRAAAATARTQS